VAVDVLRMRCVWGGIGVTGGGLSTFYFDQAGSGSPADVRAFFEAIKANIPSAVTITVPNGGDVIDTSNGALSGAWSEPSGGGITTGTFAGDYPQGVGLRVVWNTAGIYRGRRVKGSTFIVPIGAALWGLSGQLDPATQAIFQTAADTLAASGSMPVIWSRASDVAPATTGINSAVTSATVPSLVSWLRSRRT